MSPGELLDSIISDFKVLGQDYRKAGLLAPKITAGQHDLVRGLLGEAEQQEAFQRSFLWTDGLLRNRVARGLAGRAGPPHVVVFGGTKTGKSTVANVLLGTPDMAQPHHLGGFTRHAQAFLPPDMPLSDLFGKPSYAFRDFRFVPMESLQSNVFDEYSIRNLPLPSRLGNLVLWDTPDCDAVESASYMMGMVEPLTLADVVVYVTSQEKVVVRAIMKWVMLISQSGAPLVTCLNRTASYAHADIIKKQIKDMRTMATGLAIPVPNFETIAFEEVAKAGSAQEVTALLCDPAYGPGDELRAKVRQLAGTVSPISQAAQALAFVRKELDDVLRPARAELKAIGQWRDSVEAALVQFVSDYRQNYVERPERYDAFKKVSLKILELLDPPVPGLKTVLKGIRWALAWPSKVIIYFGRQVYQKVHERFFSGGNTQPTRDRKTVDNDLKTYSDAHKTLLESLGKVILAETKKTRCHPFWEGLDEKWTGALELTNEEFEFQLIEHARATQQKIDATAQAIFEELAKNPIVLHTLQTSRVATDAGAILLAVVTAGHSTFVGELIHDVLVAPALMALMEAASQLATRGYVELQRQHLRDELIKDAQTFVNTVYRPHLLRLCDDTIQQVGFLTLAPAQIESLPTRLETLAQWVHAQSLKT